MKTSGTYLLTAADVLQTGYWFSFDSEQFEIMAWDSENPLDVDARSMSTGANRHFTVMELFGAKSVTRFAQNRKELESETEKSIPRVADVTTLPEQLFKRADRIIHSPYAKIA